MSGKRITTLAVLVGLLGLGVTLLTAGKDPSEKTTEAAPKPVNAKKLVCLGYVDSETPLIKVFPDNFPQPSKVVKVLVNEGDEVKEGQILLSFDDRMYQQKIAEAKAGVEMAKAELTKAEAVVKNHDPQLQSSRYKLAAKEKELAVAKSELEEKKRVFELKGATKAEIEAKESAVSAAEDLLTAAKWDVTAFKDFVPTFAVDLAKAAVSRQEILLEQAKIASEQLACKAPADGKIVRSFASQGMLFGPHTREPAFWFLKKGPLVVRAEVHQEFAARVAKNQAAKLEDEADPSKTWKGKIIKVSDSYLPKRLGGGGMAELLQGNDDRVMECIVQIDLGKDEQAPKFGQKLRIILGE